MLLANLCHCTSNCMQVGTFCLQNLNAAGNRASGLACRRLRCVSYLGRRGLGQPSTPVAEEGEDAVRCTSALSICLRPEHSKQKPTGVAKDDGAFNTSSSTRKQISRTQSLLRPSVDWRQGVLKLSSWHQLESMHKCLGQRHCRGSTMC